MATYGSITFGELRNTGHVPCGEARRQVEVAMRGQKGRKGRYLDLRDNLFYYQPHALNSTLVLPTLLVDEREVMIAHRPRLLNFHGFWNDARSMMDPEHLSAAMAEHPRMHRGPQQSRPASATTLK